MKNDNNKLSSQYQRILVSPPSPKKKTTCFLQSKFISYLLITALSVDNIVYLNINHAHDTEDVDYSHSDYSLSLCVLRKEFSRFDAVFECSHH